MEHGAREHALRDAEERLKDGTAVALVREQAHDIEERALERHVAQALGEHGRDLVRNALRVEGVDGAEHDIMGDLAQALVAAAMFEIKGEQSRRVLVVDRLHDVLDRQQVVARERHERVHDAAAVAAQDVRAVRNAERTAEDRRDGKPVRDGRGEEAVMREAAKKAAGRERPQKTGGTDGQGEVCHGFLLHVISLFRRCL